MRVPICKKCGTTIIGETDNNGHYYCSRCGAIKKIAYRTLKEGFHG